MERMYAEGPTFGEGNFIDLIYVLTVEFWARSVHNIRIERLWVDVTTQVGSYWADIFSQLELRYGLDIHNVCHIWLLHHLFLHIINEQLQFFADAWNNHKIQIRDGPNRSPTDLFGFDMYVHGIRGDMPEDNMMDEELEVFGVDWEALQDDHILESRRRNNSEQEGWTSWVGRTGPPETLNEVVVEPPLGLLSQEEVDLLDHALLPWKNVEHDDASVINLWTQGLVRARMINNNF
jgi:hypothetical protein